MATKVRLDKLVWDGSGNYDKPAEFFCKEDPEEVLRRIGVNHPISVYRTIETDIGGAVVDNSGGKSAFDHFIYAISIKDANIPSGLAVTGGIEDLLKELPLTRTDSHPPELERHNRIKSLVEKYLITQEPIGPDVIGLVEGRGPVTFEASTLTRNYLKERQEKQDPEREEWLRDILTYARVALGRPVLQAEDLYEFTPEGKRTAGSIVTFEPMLSTLSGATFKRQEFLCKESPEEALATLAPKYAIHSYRSITPRMHGTIWNEGNTILYGISIDEAPPGALVKKKGRSVADLKLPRPPLVSPLESDLQKYVVREMVGRLLDDLDLTEREKKENTEGKDLYRRDILAYARVALRRPELQEAQLRDI
jgi:hypothetical protein